MQHFGVMDLNPNYNGFTQTIHLSLTEVKYVVCIFVLMEKNIMYHKKY